MISRAFILACRYVPLVYRVHQTIGHIRYRRAHAGEKRFFPWWIEFTR